MPQRAIRAKSNGRWLRDAKVRRHLDKDMRMNNEPVAYINEDDGLVCAKCYKPFTKELTDEELYKVYADLQENYTGNNFPVDLGRAILRKAQEK
jgi:hypothetical protein